MGYLCMQVGIRARASLVQAVTQKAFRLHTVRQEESATIVNFVSSDIQKVYDGAMVGGTRLVVARMQLPGVGQARAPAAYRILLGLSPSHARR